MAMGEGAVADELMALAQPGTIVEALVTNLERLAVNLPTGVTNLEALVTNLGRGTVK
jgi:hypothetical protein